MAAYISVPRDLTRVKSKILFGLTKRQIICFGTGALIGVPVYFFVRGSGNLSLAALSMIAVMLPFFFFGMYERNGQPPRGGGTAVLSGPVCPAESPALPHQQLLCRPDAAGRRPGGGDAHCSKKPSSGKPAGKPLLTKSERKKIDRIVKTARRDDGIPPHRPADHPL